MDPEGRLVFITTAASEHHDPKLMCFSVTTGELLWSMAAPNPAAEITVVADEKCIHVGRPHQVPGCDYLLKATYEGRVIEECPASPYEALSLAEAERQAGRSSIAERWFRVAAEADIAASYRAKAYRGLGELAEDGERPKDALDLYERALTLDANVGVKRKIQLLRKRTIE
jgi:tetratricopeptide (TPR) repeat protein